VSQFSQPGISDPEDKFVAAENNGALLLFFPREVQVGIETAHGTTDAVNARVVRLNDGRVYENALIFPTALVTQLRGAVPDGMVLGTLGQGENRKGNAPWLLSPHNAEQVAIAEQWLALNPRVAQPAPPTSPAPAAAWGAQAPVSAPPATGGWSSGPAQVPPNAAPVTPGWGGPATPPVQSQFPEGAWGAAAAVAPPAAPVAAPTATSSVHPGLVEALRKKGVNLPGDATQQTAEGIWAVVQHNPDVA
jgi:hypothetical protein